MPSKSNINLFFLFTKLFVLLVERIRENGALFAFVISSIFLCEKSSLLIKVRKKERGLRFTNILILWRSLKTWISFLED